LMVLPDMFVPPETVSAPGRRVRRAPKRLYAFSSPELASS
jgi:hypothetical protein